MATPKSFIVKHSGMIFVEAVTVQPRDKVPHFRFYRLLRTLKINLKALDGQNVVGK